MSVDLHAPAANVSLVIFGFTAETTAQDVASVLGCCGVRLRGVWADLEVALVPIPGGAGETYAHVQHVPDRLLAYRLADGVNSRRFHGRHLQSWVPVMAWS
ncbi:hypothetical protein [Sphaerotilus microaerophilus]|jgi:hypothetical protein|uniref:Uncharacterized protein n=1 Tax=Sphaerotilus microaerophilus TaxID=2914710 RepID=A0ABN6PP81_9BURK|nr:hypothetical protein [Sphaerotilus sp. FB-5]BDI06428.1 hypothetical protein CATMQ487_33980 [Sphaerotilus sp. FB-5]